MSKATEYADWMKSQSNKRPSSFAVRREDGKCYTVAEVSRCGDLEYTQIWHLHRLTATEAVKLGKWIVDTFGEP